MESLPESSARGLVQELNKVVLCKVVVEILFIYLFLINSSNTQADTDSGIDLHHYNV